MIQQSLKIVRNSIFVATVTLAAMIVTMPGEASDKGLTNSQRLTAKMGAFSGLVSTPDYNASLVPTKVGAGDRYRLNTAIPARDTHYTRSIFSVKFDQKNLLPLAATSKTLNGLNKHSGLKKRTDIALDRDRSLLADFALTGK